MNLFDQLVLEALKNQPQLSILRNVVEKELLHHDILNALNKHGLLSKLTFIGGTCLRSCYGGVRLSEDLDFTGGADFTQSTMDTMGKVLVETLKEKYGLEVNVTPPKKDKDKNVNTWKIKIETRQQQLHLPTQRINIDICSVPSYDRHPVALLNPYGVEMGTSGLIIQAESKEEIYADKLITFAFRPNRIKYRDLWDIVWLHQNSVKPRLDLITAKINDHNQSEKAFRESFSTRCTSLSEDPKHEKEFTKEMKRFVVEIDSNLWPFMIHLMEQFNSRLKNDGWL